MAPPTLLVYGWTDSLFPVDQALRWVDYERSANRAAVVGQLYTDIGHPPSPNKASDRRRVVEQVIAWHQRYLREDAAAPVVRGVEAWLHTCPLTAPSTGPIDAASFAAMHRHVVGLRGAGGSVVGDASEPVSGRATDPVASSPKATASAASPAPNPCSRPARTASSALVGAG